MKKNSFSACLLLLFVLSACNKSSDSGKIPTESELFEKGISVDIEPRMAPYNFETILTSTDFQNEDEIYKNYYSENNGAGCFKDTDGKITNEHSKNSKVIDSSWLASDEEIRSSIYASDNTDKDISESVTSTKISNRTDSSVIYNLNYTSIQNLLTNSKININSFFTAIPHVIITFNTESEQGTSKYNLTQSVIDSSKNNNNKEFKNWDCRADSSGKYTYTKSLINYNFNGKKIKALLIESKSLGKLKCEQVLSRSDETGADSKKTILNTVEFDNGETSYQYIHSRSIKSKYLVPCEGEELYYKSYTKGNGKLLKFYSSKTIAAPVR